MRVRADVQINTMKLDKYHYHELLHTINIIREMCGDHLINHHAGMFYKEDVEEIQSKLSCLYDKVSSDSDDKFKLCKYSEYGKCSISDITGACDCIGNNDECESLLMANTKL